MLVDRKSVYKGKIIDLTVDKVRIGGADYVREVVRHPGGVVVLAQLEDGRIPFVRQHRYPINRSLIELPAGKIDMGEKPEDCAARELEEETGFRPQSLEHVFSYYPTPGFCDEILHLYYTRELTVTSRKLEEDEDISVELHSFEKALGMSLRGEIIDGKTLLALFWFDWKKGQ